MILTREDNGKRIELSLDRSLEVRLPESQVSHYMWQFHEECCPCLCLVDSVYVERGPSRFNGLGERAWYLTTKEPGECQLTFYLIRPWSNPSPEFTVTVVVTRT